MPKKSDNQQPEKTAAALVRGRPRAFDRAAALEKATRLFWTKGYAATSISDLTEALGIGSPSLYAAFGSKEALYAEAVQQYQTCFKDLMWGKFFSATTAREAIRHWLFDSAAILTGTVVDIPRGCMVTLSSVGEEGYQELGHLVRSARAAPFDIVKNRITQAITDGEIPTSVDAHLLARFIQTTQNGMSILARDGVSRAELEAVAEVAMQGWDAQVASEK